jgi:hypothetical protein
LLDQFLSHWHMQKNISAFHSRGLSESKRRTLLVISMNVKYCVQTRHVASPNSSLRSKPIQQTQTGSCIQIILLFWRYIINLESTLRFDQAWARVYPNIVSFFWIIYFIEQRRIIASPKISSFGFFLHSFINWLKMTELERLGSVYA